MIVIQAISAFNDNYIWLIKQGNAAIVVDPGDAQPVQDYLQQHQLNLHAILITHHHGDHVGGVAELVQHHACPVYGPDNPKLSALIDHPVREGDTVDIAQLLMAKKATEQESTALLHVLEVPGHTMDHIAYAGEINGEQAILFCGDTLFSCGSGRIFEGDSRIMLQSLDKFKKMPQNTLIFCAHEYTLSNIKWALAVEPHNREIQEWQERATQLRAESLPTVPTHLEQELRTNPFLRVEEPAVRQAAEKYAGHSLSTSADVLGALREWKNSF